MDPAYRGDMTDQLRSTVLDAMVVLQSRQDANVAVPVSQALFIRRVDGSCELPSFALEEYDSGYLLKLATPLDNKKLRLTIKEEGIIQKLNGFIFIVLYNVLERFSDRSRSRGARDCRSRARS
jgi:hypothetical protein